ncbi:hypothetical protein ANCDUO_00187 [Ancylostoma duodenale]|uniref:DNA2/NAM7 helicase-like C-terminal domain-containing protein n=1 Tax=Ancylostoma duodenale TaxID=51022 RepID=A0A0C2H6H6_9BILA|nr:hypothetical protein ANCDUO_00187 [Ancylostoma duodenale]
MELLIAEDVPVAPLRTTFRAYPGLNDLSNSIFYEGALVSGTPVENRCLLLERITFPNPSLPFLFIDVPGTPVWSTNGSHSNELEASTSCELVTAPLSKNIPPKSVAIITFYKEQLRVVERVAGHHQIYLHTVDSVQGRERDIVILLTTRTSIQVDRAEFLDEPIHLNVNVVR